MTGAPITLNEIQRKKVEEVRDQFKANATRVLKNEPSPLKCEKVWTRGGDTQIVDGESALEQVKVYILEAQDRMGREP